MKFARNARLVGTISLLAVLLLSYVITPSVLLVSAGSNSENTAVKLTNLIRNGGFEKGQIGYMNFNHSWDDSCINQCLFSVDTLKVLSGNYSLEGHVHVGYGDGVFTPILNRETNHTLTANDIFKGSIFFGDNNSTAAFLIYFVNKTGASHGFHTIQYYLFSNTVPEDLLCCYHNDSNNAVFLLANQANRIWLTLIRHPMADLASAGVDTANLTYYLFEIGLGYTKEHPVFYDDIKLLVSQ